MPFIDTEIQISSAGRQTYSLFAAAALAPMLYQVPHLDVQLGKGTVLLHNYSGQQPSNSSVQLVASSSAIDSLLADSLTRVFARIAHNERELDVDAKRALYANRRRLYIK